MTIWDERRYPTNQTTAAKFAYLECVLPSVFKLRHLPHYTGRMPRFRHTRPFLCVLTILVFVASTARAQSPNFARDIRPILSDHCFACHGPDSANRKAGLHLDTAEGIASVVDQNACAESELLQRIISDDSDQQMPPPGFHKPLSKEQQEKLKAWVVAGARYETHWSFVPPQKSKLNTQDSPIDFLVNQRITAEGLKANPTADRRTLLRRICLDLTGLPPTHEQTQTFIADHSPQAIDHLVDRLQRSPQYGEHMARFWLDLVRYGDTHGLHLDNYREMWPYRDWVINAFAKNMPFDQFVIEQLAGDLLPDATDDQKIASGFNRLNVTTNEGGSIYDEVFARNVIDRTDAFGTIFLGLTTGCAVCHDHKFDPISQRDYYSLSGFFNSLDGRALDENIKDPAPVLRVISDEARQRIADIDATLLDVQNEMAGPIDSVDAAQAAWESSLINETPTKTIVLAPLSVASSAGVKMNVTDENAIVLTESAAAKDTTTIIAALPAGTAWQTLHLEALLENDVSQLGASENGNVVVTEITVATASAEAPNTWSPVPIKHAVADIEQTDGPFAIDYAIDGKINDSQGWGAAAHQKPGPRNAWLVVPSLAADAELPGTKIRVELKYQSKFAAHQFRRIRLSLSDVGPMVPKDQRITFSPIHSVGPFPVESPAPGYSRPFGSRGKPFRADETFSYEDRPYRWEQRDEFVPIEVNELPAITDRASVTLLHQNIYSPKAQKATLLFGSDDGHVLFLNGARIALVKGPAKLQPLHYEYTVDLKKGDNRLYIEVVDHDGKSSFSFAWRSPAIDLPQRLTNLLRTPKAERSDLVHHSLRTYFRNVYCLHPDWLALLDHKKGLTKSKEGLVAEAPTTLIWKELANPRPAKILNRGQYDQPGETVPRATPAFLPALESDDAEPLDRLALARWLCDPKNPLTARVAVNRFWQQLFGTGIVKTSEDFGSQGEPPSHQKLLDHLAIEFRESGWNVNQLIKSIVLTDAYQRSSNATPSSLAADPENRLLARGPRHRLDAEVLRDQALFLAGLLRTNVGGPSIKPPQPDGLWNAVGYSRSNTAKFTADTDDDKVYRRSLYIFWKRTSSPPMMSTFDAPSRESCTARRERTNTPLQALLLLNETQYVQAAKHLSQRVLQQPELRNDTQRLMWLFQTVTIRPPKHNETRELVSLLSDLKQYYNAKLSEAEALVGEGSAEKAAWMVVASTMLNLDEVVSK